VDTGPSSTADVPLPDGTPDVVTPLATGLISACDSIGSVPLSSAGPFGYSDGVCLNPYDGTGQKDVVEASVVGVVASSCGVDVVGVLVAEPPGPPTGC
jgi:hypothetical protein